MQSGRGSRTPRVHRSVKLTLIPLRGRGRAVRRYRWYDALEDRLATEEVMTMAATQSEAVQPGDTVSEVDQDAMAKFFRGLGDPTRLKLLEFLAGGEQNVTACVNRVGLSQGRVSVHLQCLTDCGFVSVRRDGRYAYYSIADSSVAELVDTAAGMVCRNLPGIAGCQQVEDSGE
jgi:ArsR family transcriptional regulator, cadmium/lead-responsive transcriptional repressor